MSFLSYLLQQSLKLIVQVCNAVNNHILKYPDMQVYQDNIPVPDIKQNYTRYDKPF